MSTAQQDRNFISSVISNTLLEDSIEWIKENMNPEDVFSDAQLEAWAKENGFIEDHENG